MEQSIEELEKLFKKIQDKTGIATIEEFAKIFMTSEARQFDIVKQVEEFENTLSTIESHNHSMIKEIELEKNKINLMKENSLFTKIQNEINAVQLSEKNYRKQLSQTKNHINGCIKSVSVLLNVINTKDVQHLTGNDGQYIEELLMSSINSTSSDNNSNNKNNEPIPCLSSPVRGLRGCQCVRKSVQSVRHVWGLPLPRLLWLVLPDSCRVRQRNCRC